MKHSNIPMRNDTVKRIREIRRILRSTNLPEEPDTFQKPVLSLWWLVLGVLMALVVLWLVFGSVAHAYTQEDAIKAVIGEAEGEGYQGMLAVAGAIRNRGSLHGVYGLHAKRVVNHKYSKMTYDRAVKAWNDSYYMDITNGATGWGNDEDLNIFKVSTWWSKEKITAHVGKHWFYKQEKKG